MAYELLFPDIGEGLTEGEIVQWLVSIGEAVSQDTPLVEVETDKAVVEIPAPQSGVLIHQGGSAGDVIKVGDILAVIGEEGEVWTGSDKASAAPIVGTLSEEAETLDAGAAGASTAPIQALPVVRKLARELAVDLSSVTGTGPDGRITREDVEAAAADGPQAGAEERIRLSRLRRTIAEHLSRSWREIPHVTTFDDIDGTRFLEAYGRLRDESDQPIPIEALVIQAVLPALRAFPEFNATLDGEELILKSHYDIGVAVDTPEGLIVPVAKAADTRDLKVLAAEVMRLIQAAQERTVTPAEVIGATFTVSNIGAMGGGHGTPLVPYGTTAILSVGKAEEKPIVRDGEIVAARVIPLSLSYDHRVIDGALGRRFIAAVSENLQDPSKFLS